MKARIIPNYPSLFLDNLQLATLFKSNVDIYRKSERKSVGNINQKENMHHGIPYFLNDRQSTHDRKIVRQNILNV